jgi:hypothetical protein
MPAFITADPAARWQVVLSGILCALIGADAYIPRFLVLNDLGEEGNHFLKSWVTEPAFFYQTGLGTGGMLFALGCCANVTPDWSGLLSLLLSASTALLSGGTC